MTTHFEKHITTNSTGLMYEKGNSGKYYRIYEIENNRYIDPDNYNPFLNWDGTMGEISKDPIPLTDKQKWDQIRAQRTGLLRSCDWTQLDDVDLTTDQKNAWKNYRKALRDIPQTYAYSDKVVWPIAPSI